MQREGVARGVVPPAQQVGEETVDPGAHTEHTCGLVGPVAAAEPLLSSWSVINEFNLVTVFNLHTQKVVLAFPISEH